MDTGIESRAYKTLLETASTIENPILKDWKENNGKVVGYFCSSFPEELIAAAGLLPFRMRATGSEGTELSDAFFTSTNCSFPRHAFNVALEGGFDFLDGLFVFNSCDNVRRIWDHWKRQLDTPYLEMVSLPKKADPAQVDWFKGELSLIKGRMEKHFDIEITNEQLFESIQLHNKTRELQRSLYELRKTKNPPITGAETLAVIVAGTAMPKATYNALLEELLDDLGKVPERDLPYRKRVMILGSELENPEYMEVIEGQGALIVTDSLCFGTRILWKDVGEDRDDPIGALAQFYVADRPSCPRVYGKYEDRLQFLQDHVKEFNVDGIILERLAFCDMWGFEQFSLTNDLKELDIPLLIMEREYASVAVGQVKTRVQAFLERLEG